MTPLLTLHLHPQGLQGSQALVQAALTQAACVRNGCGYIHQYMCIP